MGRSGTGRGKFDSWLTRGGQSRSGTPQHRSGGAAQDTNQDTQGRNQK